MTTLTIDHPSYSDATFAPSDDAPPLWVDETAIAGTHRLTIGRRAVAEIFREGGAWRAAAESVPGEPVWPILPGSHATEAQAKDAAEKAVGL